MPYRKEMKKLFLVALVIFSGAGYAQKIKEYKAYNGFTYHIKDTVRLGKGSGADGWFVYVLASSLNTSDAQRDWLKRKFTNGYVILKSIDRDRFSRYKFIVGGGALYNFHINIDEAIQAGEVTLNTNKAPINLTMADELLKLKSLLDAGALTRTEYDEQKKKLLNQ